MASKKVSRMRGRKTHGWGCKKKHRGAGSRGGRGLSGSKNQRKFWIIKNKPGHFGKYGFKSLKTRKLKPSERAINLRDIARLAEGKEVDLKQLGYDRVLGTGSLDKPLTIKAGSFTKKAAEKIEKAGGKAVSYGEEKREKVPEVRDSGAKPVDGS
jgi:large subunit ribosomal protein L15